MDTVIRQNQSQTGRAGAANTIILVLLAGLVGVSLLATILSASSFGWQGYLFLGAVFFVGMFGILTLIASREKGDPVEYDLGADPITQAFLRNPEACLLVKDGKPLMANTAYMELARAVGATGASDSAPTVDRLFSASGKETASAVFRLHHMPANTATAEESIDLLTPEGLLRRYKVHVTNLGDAQLWKVSNVTALGLSGERTLVRAPVGLFSVDQKGRVIALNRVMERWLGVTDRVSPTLLREFIEDADVLLGNPPETGRVIRADTRLITQKGVVTPTIMVATWEELDNGEPYASVALYGHSSLGVQRTVTTPTKLRGADKDVGPISDNGSFSASPVAILKLVGSKLSTAIIKNANPAFDVISGNTAWREAEFASIFARKPGGYHFLRKTASQCKPDKPFTAVLAGPGEIPVSVYVSPDATDANTCWVYIVDTSARKSLEDQLVQSQKMQAIGQLAGGVAHDFNNLLTALRLNTDELLGRHPVGDPSYPDLQQINSNVTRAAGLVKKLLAFSSKQTLRAERLDVSDTLSDVSVLLRQVLVERVKLNVVHGRGLPPIRVDKVQLETVLMNLCVNARDAMADSGGGVITIRSSKLSRDGIKDEQLMEILQDIPGETFVVIDVADTGTGMSDEVKAKIFEPFFTTKEIGKGTGLGLATVYGIIQQSGGHVTVESKLGAGTTFRIYLPEASADEAGQDAPIVRAESKVKKPANLSGQGNILFVEDEASVRTIAAKTLRKRGYKVTEAEDGEEAYEILEDASGPFDLMISDVVMPGMDGPALLKKGRTMLGDARIVFISGYAEEEFSDLLAEEPDVTFLPKPFTLAQLAEKVKAEIGENDLD